MEEALLIEKLLLFGLGRQEAAIYLCLLKNSELTGYEVAKLTGISRSNVYNSLASLVEHGAAYVSEGASTRYTAVCLKEFCDNRLRFLKDVGAYLVENGPKPIIPSEGYITVEGYGHICDKIHHMLLGAEKRIYFSATGAFLEMWKEEISELVRRGSKVVLISEDSSNIFSEQKELREGIIFYEIPENMDAADRKRQVRLIIDSEYVLTGEVEGTSNDTCLYSAQKNFVNVFKDAMRNEIELIKLKGKR
ncbi:MAG: TrmB family transcriptional regulator [Lachnospiraceae bacterium]|nr:TrmB family transcriptional regulator [Lachnospiraceae bacterium]